MGRADTTTVLRPDRLAPKSARSAPPSRPLGPDVWGGAAATPNEAVTLSGFPDQVAGSRSMRARTRSAQA